MPFYLEFIRFAIGVTDTFLFLPSASDWHRLYDFCKRQALLGVGFVAVRMLHERGVECPRKIGRAHV